MEGGERRGARRGRGDVGREREEREREVGEKRRFKDDSRRIRTSCTSVDVSLALVPSAENQPAVGKETAKVGEGPAAVYVSLADDSNQTVAKGRLLVVESPD